MNGGIEVRVVAAMRGQQHLAFGLCEERTFGSACRERFAPFEPQVPALAYRQRHVTFKSVAPKPRSGMENEISDPHAQTGALLAENGKNTERQVLYRKLAVLAIR